MADITPREKRRLVRVEYASWLQDQKIEKFIINFLTRRGISYKVNQCPYNKENGTVFALKDFRKIGCGGVGLVWGCSLCRNYSSAIELAQSSMDKKKKWDKLPRFTGTCRIEDKSGDVDKLIIIPRVTKPPFQLQVFNQFLDTPKLGVIQRSLISVLE